MNSVAINNGAEEAMRGVVFPGERALEIMTFPDPAPGPGEVVLEMKASGMCGSDLTDTADRKTCRARAPAYRPAPNP